MQQETLLEKAWNLAQTLTLGAALVLPSASFASSATVTPQYVQGNLDSSSLSTTVLNHSPSQDIQRAMRELEIARSLLNVLAENVEAASLTYVDRLREILDAATAVSSERLPAHSRSLADRLQSVRAELLESVAHPKTWLAIFKVVNPEGRPVLPQRFISRRPGKLLELPASELRAAAYLRSDEGPHTV